MIGGHGTAAISSNFLLLLACGRQETSSGMKPNQNGGLRKGSNGSSVRPMFFGGELCLIGIPYNVSKISLINLGIKTEPFAVGADADIFVSIILRPNTYRYMPDKSQTYTVASAPAVTGSVFMRRFRLFLAWCWVEGVKG